MTKPLCIHHHPCADGFMSALAVWRYFKGEVDFHPGKYGAAPPLAKVAGRDVIIVDFSYSRDALINMADNARTMLVLDHHVSAQRDLEADNNYICDLRKYSGVIDWRRVQEFRDQDQMEGVPYARVYALFDMDRSGAGIAWDFFLDYRPPLVNHVEDRDLWRFALPGTREIQAALFSYPYDFELWDKFTSDSYDASFLKTMAEGGRAIMRKQMKDTRELIESNLQWFMIDGYLTPTLNIPYAMGSEACNLLLETIQTNMAAYYTDGQKSTSWGLRSVKGLDSSAIAKKFGGGGHAQACGFNIKHGSAPGAQLMRVDAPS